MNHYKSNRNNFYDYKLHASCLIWIKNLIRYFNANYKIILINKFQTNLWTSNNTGNFNRWTENLSIRNKESRISFKITVPGADPQLPQIKLEILTILYYFSVRVLGVALRKTQYYSNRRELKKGPSNMFMGGNVGIKKKWINRWTLK